MCACMCACLIITLTQYLTRRDKLWIAMEFCGGGSLQDIYHGMMRWYDEMVRGMMI